MADALRKLLKTAAHDLRAGADLYAARAPGIADKAADEDLRRLLDETVDRARTHAAVIGRSGLDKGGDDNLWMAGILDDAERDTKTIEAGQPRRRSCLIKRRMRSARSTRCFTTSSSRSTRSCESCCGRLCGDVDSRAAIR